MTSDSEMDEPPSPGVFDTLLMPLRLPGRVVADVGTLAQGVADLVEGVRALHGSVDRIDNRVEQLASLEATIEAKMEQLREDLNTRMGAVGDEVHAMQAPMEQMARDVAKIDDLLPNPNDGPLTRLKDTLSSGGS